MNPWISVAIIGVKEKIGAGNLSMNPVREADRCVI
jgi:hypothetical protein